MNTNYILAGVLMVVGVVALVFTGSELMDVVKNKVFLSGVGVMLLIVGLVTLLSNLKTSQTENETESITLTLPRDTRRDANGNKPADFIDGNTNIKVDLTKSGNVVTAVLSPLSSDLIVGGVPKSTMAIPKKYIPKDGASTIFRANGKTGGDGIKSSVGNLSIDKKGYLEVYGNLVGWTAGLPNVPFNYTQGATTFNILPGTSLSLSWVTA